MGGGVFVCIYSSTVAWTAVLGRVLLGRRVVAVQWMGVLTVCVGLGLTALAHSSPAPADTPDPASVSRVRFMVGVFTTLLGSMLHSGMLVLSDGLVRMSISWGRGSGPWEGCRQCLAGVQSCARTSLGTSVIGC